jgi:hypothetical protein
MKLLKRIIEEPLLHFFAAGVIIFAITLGDTRENDDTENVIAIDDGTIDHLTRVHTKTWQRPPNEEELEGLVNERIREEVYYREALKMGLDQDDTIIRRRLRQKLEFLAATIAEAVEPTDEELNEHLQANAEDFREPEYVTLRSIYFDQDKRRDEVNNDATFALEQLNESPSESWEDLGDATRLPHRLEMVSLQRIHKTFGLDFTLAVIELPVGEWSGPIASNFGVHLVLLEERIPGEVAPLDEVRKEVLTEWAYKRKQEIQEEFYQTMLEQYEIVYELESGDRPE